jgi:putative restriction endonuclease
MGFGVFIHRTDSIYDDVPSERYQFPPQYLTRVQACIGDWIVYYEPRKAADTRGYFAVAKVQEVIPDPGTPRMYLAIIEAGSYLPLGNPVPFSRPDGLVEQGLLNEAGAISGRAQAAVRRLSAEDFNRIVSLGVVDEDEILPRLGDPATGFGEDTAPFIAEQARERVAWFTSHKVRARNFRRIVLTAYGEQCAITGLRLINGGGRAEVVAAHIRPVEHDGPDDVRNGLALSGTIHWMFDRGLVSLNDDLRIMVSRQVNDPAAAQTLVNSSGHLLPPHRAADRPHPAFLNWHRENCFKQ